MDLLRAAYPDDDDPQTGIQSQTHQNRTYKSYPIAQENPKRRKLWQEKNYNENKACNSYASVGRYISKRERAAQTSNSDLHCTQNPVVGSIADLKLPSRIQAQLRHYGEGNTHHNRIPKGQSIKLKGHTKAVNAVQWSPTHGHLLASAGMDQVAYIWNVWNGEGQQNARMLTHHNAAVKDLQWSKQGLHLLTCGYDQTCRLTDVETGSQIQEFSDDQIVSVVKFHPQECHLFLAGGTKGTLRLWDIRANKVTSEYLRGLGPIMDTDISYDGKHFVSSSDVSQTNSSEKSIVVWDVRTQAPISNQVYVEAYTCPCVRYHPVEAAFVVQSNGNYIAIFSSNPPFKLNKYKRYEKHSVSGFPIRCNFSQDGEFLATGSADGSIYFYSYKSSKLLRQMQAYGHACTDVVYHPLIPSVVASCSWNGDVSVFE